MTNNTSTGLRIFAAVAMGFGLLTIVSGGSVLFGGEAIAQAAGNTVWFVLWFNFLSGAVYVLAGAGIFLGRAWGAALAWLLAAALVAVFAGFGWHAFTGGAYEPRTLGAMILRSGFWIALALTVGWPGARSPNGAR